MDGEGAVIQSRPRPTFPTRVSALAIATSDNCTGNEGVGFLPRRAFLMGAVLCLVLSACALRVPASIKPSIGNEGAFGTSAVGVGKWSWVRTYSYLPGPTRKMDWQQAAAFGLVKVHATAGGIDADSALMLAEDIQAAIDYLYPRGGASVPVERVDVFLVPAGFGADEQHSSMGRRGKLSARFHVRNLGAENLPEQRAYTAGTVAHELVHIQRGLAGIAGNDMEEPIAHLVEVCAVLTVMGQVSPTFSQIASRSPASERERELVSSARAAAGLAHSLPPTVRVGTDPARALLDSCEEHRDASRMRGTR